MKTNIFPLFCESETIPMFGFQESQTLFGFFFCAGIQKYHLVIA
jgi:hypothetical protein